MAARTAAVSEPSPTPRKVWQVPATPAPTVSSPPPQPAAPDARRRVEAANLPAAPSPPKPAAPPVVPPAPVPVAAAPAPPKPRAAPSLPASPAPAPPAPARAVAAPAPPARPAATVPAVQPPVANGATARTPAAPAPQPASADEESPVWDKIGADTDDPTAKTDTAPRSARRPAGRKRTTPPPVDTRRLWWLMGGVAVVACILVAVLLWWALRHGSETDKPVAPERPVIRINRKGRPDSASTLREALNRIKAKPGVGGRIILEQDVTDEIRVDIANVTIESPEEGPPFTWKAIEKPGPNAKVLVVYNAADFHLKNVVLDGENRAEALVALTGTCPGTTLENVAFKGIQKYGLWVASCEGGESPDRHVALLGLTFETQKADQSALFFDAGRLPNIPKNRDVTVRNCTFKGPGTKIRIADPAKMESVELPEGIPPVNGG
jgi:hypothetical protein